MVEWLGRYAQFSGIGPICPGRGGGCMGTTLQSAQQLAKIAKINKSMLEGSKKPFKTHRVMCVAIGHIACSLVCFGLQTCRLTNKFAGVNRLHNKFHNPF